jgi:hypothetical protein
MSDLGELRIHDSEKVIEQLLLVAPRTRRSALSEAPWRLV